MQNNSTKVAARGIKKLLDPEYMQPQHWFLQILLRKKLASEIEKT